jgi:hypothetical protein
VTSAQQVALDDLVLMNPQRFHQFTQDQLNKLLSEPKLYAAAKSMATNKSPGPDSVIIEFCIKFWSLIGQDYIQMVQDSI